MTIKGKHKCTLGLGSESMLLKKPNASWCRRACRELHKLILVSEHHPLVFSHFRSYPAMLAERQRHLLENKYVIHPFSIFSFAWRSFMIFVTLTHMGLSSLELCIFIGYGVIFWKEYALASLQAICLIDMIVQFNTSYFDKKMDLIVLERRRIAWSYLRCYWLTDLLSCMPVALVLVLMEDDRPRWHYLVADFLPILRFVRICTVLEDLQTLLQTLIHSQIWYRVIRHFIWFILILHCFTCLIYFPTSVIFYTSDKIPSGYTGFLNTKDKTRVITDLPFLDRYFKGMFVAISAFFSTGPSMFTSYNYSEIIINSAVLLFGAMFKMYTITFALKTYTTVYNSTMRYQELMDQVENYMHHQQFPAPLMRRLRDFYSYRYQGRYYKEKMALGGLSAQLQNEILLHTYQDFVEKAPVLQGIPPKPLGRLLGCLEPEVYMPSDLIVHAGDDGNCMYFIYIGTVALYSLKGVEDLVYLHVKFQLDPSSCYPVISHLLETQVYHLEDGDFFGVVALLRPESKRLTTIVAIEMSQVYRLSAENFRKYVVTNPELYNRLRKETEERLHSISMVDDLVLLERRRQMNDSRNRVERKIQASEWLRNVSVKRTTSRRLLHNHTSLSRVQ